jgi:GTP pyrophosphokinase
LEVINVLTHYFDEALLMASRVHASQTRKGTNIPYVAHVLGVAAIALEHGATENQAIAALLHDAIEDGEGEITRREIARRFEPVVERIVMGCSDSDGGDKAPWIVRKCCYLAHLPKADTDVLFVSACDKLHNLRSILTDLSDPAVGRSVFNRFKAQQAGTLWYYGSLVDIYRESGRIPVRLVEDLNGALRELEDHVGGSVARYPDIPELPEIALTGVLRPDDATELLTIYGEGVKIALYGISVAIGNWLYFVDTNDSTWELLEGDDALRPEPVPKRTLIRTLDAALEQLDRYPWIQLHPAFLHPEFVSEVGAAVQHRIAQFRVNGEEVYSLGDWERVLQEARESKVPH